MDGEPQRGRGKRGKGKRTLLREANMRRAAEEAAAGIKPAFKTGDLVAIADSMAVMEEGMRFFYNLARTESSKKRPNLDRCRKLWLDATAIANNINPYRYAKLASVKFAQDPNAMRFQDAATIDELKAQIMEQILAIGILPDDIAKMIELKPVGVANR